MKDYLLPMNHQTFKKAPKLKRQYTTMAYIVLINVQQPTKAGRHTGLYENQLLLLLQYEFSRYWFN